MGHARDVSRMGANFGEGRSEPGEREIFHLDSICPSDGGRIVVMKDVELKMKGSDLRSPRGQIQQALEREGAMGGGFRVCVPAMERVVPALKRCVRVLKRRFVAAADGGGSCHLGDGTTGVLANFNSRGSWMDGSEGIIPLVSAWNRMAPLVCGGGWQRVGRGWTQMGVAIFGENLRYGWRRGFRGIGGLSEVFGNEGVMIMEA